jgi:hypothetical protein
MWSVEMWMIYDENPQDSNLQSDLNRNEGNGNHCFFTCIRIPQITKNVFSI